MDKLKYKFEYIDILNYDRCKDIKYKTREKARTFIYNNHKFNLQGNKKTGYRISDNATGCLVGGKWFYNFEDVTYKEIATILNYFFKTYLHSNEYKKLLSDFRTCTIYREI